MDNTLQMYVKNRKPYVLPHKDVKHKAQLAALLSFLVTVLRQSNSVTALWDLWPGIWTQGNAHWNKAETAGSAVLVIRSLPGTQQSPEARASSSTCEEVPLKITALLGFDFQQSVAGIFKIIFVRQVYQCLCS